MIYKQSRYLSMLVFFVVMLTMSLFPQNLFAQTGPLNLGFEDPIIYSHFFDRKSRNWSTHPLNDSTCFYNTTTTENEYYRGKYSLMIRPNEYTHNVDKIISPYFDGIRQEIDAQLFRGKRVRYSIYSKSLLGEERGHIGYAIISNSSILRKDNFKFSPSTSKWKQYEFVFDVDSQATSILLSIFMTGKGTTLFDSVSFDVIDKSIKTRQEKMLQDSKHSIVQFFNGQQSYSVTSTDISYISGTHDQGVVFLKNGQQIRYTYFPKESFNKIKEKK